MEIPSAFTQVPIQSAGASTGDGEILLAAVAGKVNRLHGMVAGSTTAATLTVSPGSTETALTGAIPMAAGVPLLIPFDPRKEGAIAAPSGKGLFAAVTDIVGGYAIVSQSTI